MTWVGRLDGMAHDGHSRRRFLGTALLGGASVALLGGDDRTGLKARWGPGRAYPFAVRTCGVDRGVLPEGVEAELRLVLEGPGLEGPLVVATERRRLVAQVERWTVRLAYNHPRHVAGVYEYRVEVRAGGAAVRSGPAGYDIPPFVPGV